MKPLGGIVTSKKSVPENFRQVENFTTEYLSKLWKIYTINRDVLDKGRRLENLFWRIWGSERIERTFSGAKVSAIFMMIVEEQGSFEHSEYRIPSRQIPPLQITAPPPHPMETFATPRPSLEIECPPTPPPSPIRPVTSVVGFQLGSYLAKFPSQTAITASLQQAFPDAPPSPPIPPIRPPVIPILPEKNEFSNLRSTQLSAHQTSGSNLSVTVSKDQQPCGTVASEEEEGSTSSKDGLKKGKAQKARTERPARGRRKIVAKKAITARAAAARKIRPAVPRRKSSSSSNTAVNTAVSSPSNTLTVDVAQSLPSTSQKRQRNFSTPGGSESEGSRKKSDPSAGGWVVDPDFRTKYLERIRREKLVALTSIMPVTSKTTSAIETVVTASAKISRGKGKNVLVVDGIVPLKGLADDARDTQVAKIKIGNVSDEEIDELPSNLVRQKSELTLLFEGAKKAEEESGKKRATKAVQVIVEGEIRR